MPEPRPHTRRTIAFIAGTLLVLSVLIVLQFLKSPPVISAQAARELIARDSTVVLLDVRTGEEFRGPLGHLPAAIRVPVDSLAQALDQLESLKGRTLVVYCRSGRRSMNATTFLREKGFNALNLEGGILSWRESKYPVEGGNP